MPETTAIAVTEKSVAQFVQSVLPNLKNYAVRTYDAEAWAKTVMLCIVENPELMTCMSTSIGKASLYHALRYAATTGLSLNPQEGKAALVPIKGKVNYWIEKNGMIDLIMETGAVKLVRANAVRANDKFRLTETLDGDNYEFSPATRNRGEITGFFAAIKLKDGGSLVHYMSREEVEAHRDTYGKGLDRPDSAWRKSFEGMGIKTVIKAICRRVSLSEVEAVVELAKDGEEGVETISGEFTEIPGVTAAEVEKKLAEKKAAEPEPAGNGKGAKPAEQSQTTQGAEHPTAQTTATSQQSASTPAAAAKPKGELDIF